jgi:hypothetical protein
VRPYGLVANYQRYFHPEDEGIRFLQNDGNQLTGHKTFVEYIYIYIICQNKGMRVTFRPQTGRLSSGEKCVLLRDSYSLPDILGQLICG